MARIRIYGVFLCVTLILATVFSGCGGKGSLPDYREEAFSATVEWTVGELSVKARVETDLQGSMRIELTSPEELSGILLLSRGEKRQILCGDVTLEGERMAPLFEMAELILPAGERRVVCKTEWEGEPVVYAEVEGEEQTALYLKSDSGIPVAVARGEVTVRVQNFEGKSEGGESP